MANSCGQYGHRYFVADVAVIPEEGKVVVLALCTACGAPIENPHIVAKPYSNFTIENNKRKEV